MLFLLGLIDEGVGEGEIENGPVPPCTEICLHHRVGNDYSQELPRVNLFEEGLSNNDKNPSSLTNQHSVVLPAMLSRFKSLTPIERY